MTTGIYMIRNALTQRVYVGQTAYLEKREMRHFRDLERGLHHCSHLQNSFCKYGREEFSFAVLEECSVAELTTREQFWMDKLKAFHGLYNTAPVAGSVLGIKRTPEHRAKIAAALRGKKHTPERIAKVQKAREGFRFSAESRRRMSEKRRGKPRPPEVMRKVAEALRGRPKSAEHRAKLSEAAKRRYAACR